MNSISGKPLHICLIYTPPILERLSIEPDKWLYTSSHFESSFKSLVGTAQSMLSKFKHLGYQRTPKLTAGLLLT